MKAEVEHPRWSTRKQAAEHAQCSPRTIDRWISAGTLASRKVGNIIRVDLNELDALLTLEDGAK